MLLLADVVACKCVVVVQSQVSISSIIVALREMDNNSLWDINYTSFDHTSNIAPFSVKVISILFSHCVAEDPARQSHSQSVSQTTDDGRRRGVIQSRQLRRLHRQRSDPFSLLFVCFVFFLCILVIWLAILLTIFVGYHQKISAAAASAAEKRSQPASSSGACV